MVADDNDRRSAPAALRNRDPIADVLADWLPPTGLVLEVASGTGEHACHFARKFPALDFQPSDQDPGALRSIAAWREDSGLANLRAPIELDVAQADWPIDSADAVLATNMVHISPWVSSLGLIAGSAQILARGSPLILYGPWLRDDVDTAPTNLAFDRDLKSRDERWGLRRVEDFAEAAAAHGFDLVEERAMPANNRMLHFRLNSPAKSMML